MDHPPRHCNSWDVNKEYPIWNFRKAPHIQNFQIGSSCLFFTKQRHGLFKCLVVIYNLKITFSISPFSSCLSPKPTLLTKDSQSCKKKNFFLDVKMLTVSLSKKDLNFPVLRLHKQMLVWVWWTFLPDLLNLWQQQ